MTNKTLDQLAAITTPAGTDLLAILRPVSAVLQNITWSNIVAALTGTFLQKASNLLDVADAPTARTNLGLGTAATQATGTSGASVPLLNTSVSWTGTVTATGFSGPLTGAVTGNVTGNVSGSSGSCTGNAATATTAATVGNGAITPAKLSAGGPSWDGAGNFSTGDNITAGGNLFLGSNIQITDVGSSQTVFFNANTYLQYIPGSNTMVLVKGGATVATW